MYKEHFGFKEAPFSIAPDPHYLYMTAQHREALAHLVYGLNSEGGCILLTGEVGTGKTTICRCLLEQIPEYANIALLLNPKITAIELLATICDELKIDHPVDKHSVKNYIDLINNFLLEANARGEKTVLIIDEAQNLDSTVLEQLRLLTNLETNQRKLLQIVILGQPELLDILSRKNMRQLSQRITARFHLVPLSKNEIKAYISHRIAIAGQNVQLFPDDVINRIYQLSGGIPRLINIICDRALLGTYVQNRTVVDRATVNQAAKEIFGELGNPIHSNSTYGLSKRGLALAASAALIFVASVLFIKLSPYQNESFSPAETVSSQKAEMKIAKSDEDSSLLNDIIDVIDTSDTENVSAPETVTATSDNHEEHARNIARLDEMITKTDGDKSSAYQLLFSLWGQNYDARTDGNECSHASSLGLSCLHRAGNLHSLKRLNRPAVIKIYSNSGKNAFVTLTRLDESTATLSDGTSEINIDIATLDSHWFGEYTLLWQKPPFYESAVMPGKNGPIVQWLDQQLVRIYGHATTPTINDTYNSDLVTMVKNFQQDKGLFPDGIAGPRTLIHLNNALGLSAPKLLRINNT